MAATSESVTEPVIRVSKLKVSYGKNVAVCNLNLQIARRQVTALVGPSGSGKSTLLLALNRLLESVGDVKLAGDIELDGESIFASQVELAKLRRRIGTVFQRPTVFPISIYENIAVPVKEMGVNKKSEVMAIVENVLHKVGLWDEVKERLQAPATGLSGGQMQRLCMARALALNPDIILLDEPCSSLDPIASRKIEDLILKLRGEKTIVIVTHNLAQARRVADHVALLWPCAPENCAGTILEFSDAPSFFNNPQTQITRDYVSGALG